MTNKKVCPITYAILDKEDKHSKYSVHGLKKLSPILKNLQDFAYSAKQQLLEARQRADKMSIQGVQPKLSAKLNVNKECFVICDHGGNYILKPQHRDYDQLPENEDLSMRLAEKIIAVPFHGLMYCSDGSFTYFIKRFDRGTRGKKQPLEDFAQLAGATRETKYNYSMEKIIDIMEQYCSFPVIEKRKLFIRVIFNYLIGNEDMHLKNYSLISNNEIIQLAPAYDFINTTISIGINQVREQIALPLNGKKNNLTKKDLLEYYGQQKLELNLETIDRVLDSFKKNIPDWINIIERSFLSEKNKKDYYTVLMNRAKNLDLT